MFEYLHTINEDTAHTNTCYTLLALAPIVFVTLHYGGQKAEYGRYSKAASGLMTPIVPGRMDWFLHATSLLSVYLALQRATNDDWKYNANFYILVMFVLHYLWRSIGFALMVKNPKPMSIPLALSTSGFCLMNGWLQARSAIFYETTPINIQFYIGTFFFFLGWCINVTSDWTLIHLRKGIEDKKYYVPKGGLFEYVSGANFFGEILEWFGLAMASGFTLSTTTFVVFTFANLAPRAHQHHQWYLNKFKEEYPKNRKALVPFVW